MTGEDHLTAGVESGLAPPARAGRGRAARGGAAAGPGAEPIDFALHAGELVGLAGLEGHGQDAFLRALHGAGRSGGWCAATR